MAELKHRERTTRDALEAIDAKLARLTAARAERAKALQFIRSALARATLAAPAEPEKQNAFR